jgi:hypothetical protein
LVTMYDSYIVKRTQIYLEAQQHAQLARRAKAEGVTASSLVRRAIDRYLNGGDDEGIGLERFRAAVDAAAGAAPQLAEGQVYVERLRAFDESRRSELEQRRRA